ncbi:hypothetical protein O6H91_Y326000 [Diphasiastrum complanatum]|nr:hypothetical protein O6H91_Y326000 [Diphasiastrum complanatum]
MVTFKTFSFVESLNPIWNTMYDQQSQVPVHLTMLLTQFLFGVYYVITKVAFMNGLNPIVLSLYRDLVALLVLLPAAYYSQKKNPLELSFSVLSRLFLLGCTWSLSPPLKHFPPTTHTHTHTHTHMQKQKFQFHLTGFCTNAGSSRASSCSLQGFPLPLQSSLQQCNPVSPPSLP